MRFATALLVVAIVGPASAAQPVPPPAASSVDWSKAEVIEVTLSDFAFKPSTVHLQRGRPYALRLTNVGSGGHNFASKDLFAASTVAAPDQSAIKKGRIEVGKGETQTVRFAPLTAGKYAIKCTHFLHSGFGMKGSAIIQ
jgi:plastocyanin